MSCLLPEIGPRENIATERMHLRNETVGVLHSPNRQSHPQRADERLGVFDPMPSTSEGQVIVPWNPLTQLQFSRITATTPGSVRNDADGARSTERCHHDFKCRVRRRIVATLPAVASTVLGPVPPSGKGV
jgi:hypothetical protein